jgi:hypothetical protein
MLQTFLNTLCWYEYCFELTIFDKQIEQLHNRAFINVLQQFGYFLYWAGLIFLKLNSFNVVYPTFFAGVLILILMWLFVLFELELLFSQLLDNHLLSLLLSDQIDFLVRLIVRPNLLFVFFLFRLLWLFVFPNQLGHFFIVLHEPFQLLF